VRLPPRRAAVTGALAVLALAGLGCGKKGPPVAPELRRPAPPAAVSAQVDEAAIVLAWTTPRTRVDGTRLRDLVGLRIHRREEAMSGPPKPAMLVGGEVVGYEEIARIALDAPGPAEVQGDQVRWTDRRGLTVGGRYVYVATAQDSTGRLSPPSERLVVTFLAAPEAPRNLAAAGGERQVRLRWDPPAALRGGAPLAGELRYVVLRAAGPDAPLAPVTPEPIAATAMTDRAVENDVTYRYAVRALRVEPGGTARGPLSPVVSVTPVKTTPPRPPSELVALPTPGGVRLAWRPSPDEDVAGYVVYRAMEQGPFVRIGHAPAVSTLFTDRDVLAAGRYRYVVTAVDRSRTPNESARSNEAGVTVP
jgi:hypothetical protein